MEVACASLSIDNVSISLGFKFLNSVLEEISPSITYSGSVEEFMELFSDLFEDEE